jgi:glycosyltransferase involved in cell wall biosynthesis
VLLTSINEGTPTALIEAMFAAKPFVATDAGGTSDLAINLRESVHPGIREGENGFIVERQTSAVVDCLVRLERDSKLRDVMGRRGQQHAIENWNSDRLLNDMRQLYCDLTRTRSRSQSV